MSKKTAPKSRAKASTAERKGWWSYPEKVPADAFKIDLSYNRQPDEDRVVKMARNWNPSGLGMVLASKRANGSFYLLDGGHRTSTLKKIGRGRELVDTLVYEGMTREEEAEVFTTFNKERKPPTPSQMHKAEVVKGDIDAIEIQKVVDDLDLVFDSYGKPTDVKCVAAVRAVHKRMGMEGLHATLALLKLAWGDKPRESMYHQSLVAGVSRVLYWGGVRGNGVDSERLRNVLAGQLPVDLISSAKQLKGIRGGGDTAKIVCEEIVRLYNRSLSPRRQIIIGSVDSYARAVAVRSEDES